MSIFIDFVWSSGYAFEFAQYAQTAMAKGKTPTDGGFAVLIQEFGLDMGLLFFNVFTACYLENLLMLIGTFTQNLAGAANYTTTIVYEAQAYVAGSEDSLLLAFERSMSAYYYDYDECAKTITYFFA